MRDGPTPFRAKDYFDIVGSLPQKNIDTGMGLERVAYLLQGVDNMYEIDVMYPVIERASDPSARGRTRAGAPPGNEGGGYVVRGLLRGAIRSMRLLGCEDRVLPELMPLSR